MEVPLLSKVKNKIINHNSLKDMKTKTLAAAFILLCIVHKGSAQNWNYNTYTNTGGTAYLGSAGANDIIFGANSTQYMNLQGTTGYLGIGNNFAPSHLLDVYGGDINVSSSNNSKGYMIGGNMVLWHGGDSTSLFCGVHAGSSPSNASMGNANNIFVGFKADAAANGNANYTNNVAIGSQAMQANTASYNIAIGSEAFANNTYCSKNIAIGYQALYSQSFANSNASYSTDNIAIGYQALYNNNPTTNSPNYSTGNVALGDYALYNNTTGIQNTVIGWVAGKSNTTGVYNTFVGGFAGNANTIGEQNTFIGLAAGEANTSGGYNTFIGSDAGVYNDIGTENSFLGMECGTDNTTGSNNTFNGFQAGDFSRSGNGNSFYGSNSGQGANIDGNYNDASGYYSLHALSTGNSNVATGANSLYNTSSGTGNVALGYNAGFSVTTDDNNLFLGSAADRGASVITNAAAIGYNTIVTADNQMELGNNDQTITIGMSGYAPIGPVTRLEINTQTSGAPFNVNWASVPPSYVNPGNGGTGWSGLRFDDLKAASTPGKNPGQGYLSVDTAGNVIYVNAPAITSGTKNQDSMLLSQTIDSVRVLHNVVDSLRTAFKGIQACLDKLCSATVSTGPVNLSTTSNNTSATGVSGDNTEASTTNIQDVNLSSADVPVLYQNMANPFSTFTKINYYLPQGTNGATMVFYDNYGNQIKLVQLTQTGNGTLNITSDNLSNGIYSYSLVVNNNVVDTKRMVLQR